MKNFILFTVILLFFALCVLCIGCSENPVSPVTDSDTLTFSIFAEYGYCDSIACYGQSIILCQIFVTNSACYVDTLTTLDSIIVAFGRKLPLKYYLTLYNGSGNININDQTLTFSGTGIDTTLRLNFNQSYIFNYCLLP